MSRNLCRTDCYYCNGRVVLEEAPRPMAESDCGEHYLGIFGGTVTVGHAICEDCEAKYLAWVSERGRHAHDPVEGVGFYDLSFRSSFNDEPGPEDLPRYQIVVKRERHPIQRCGVCETPVPDRYCWRCSRRVERFA